MHRMPAVAHHRAPWRFSPARLLLVLALLLPAFAAGILALPAAAASAPSGLAATVRTMNSQQCLSCHPLDAGRSHPVNVTPSMALPAGMPLTGNRMTCTTCHLDTIEAHAAARGGITGDKFLRATGTTSFCAACHSSVQFDRRGQHPRAVTQAHPDLARQRGSAPSLLESDTSHSCLGCHDGTVASDAFSSPGGSMRANHSTGVAYGRRGRSKLIAPDRLDARIELPNGQVACTSCHNLYSREPKLLVMRNDASKLCRSCHAVE